MLVRKLGHCSDISHLHVGVGRGLEVDHLGISADRSSDGSNVSHVHMPDLDPELADTVVQEGEGTAIQSAPY
ncbi:hypothetical protein D3C78_1720830 [compost metagenome]